MKKLQAKLFDFKITPIIFTAAIAFTIFTAKFQQGEVSNLIGVAIAIATFVNESQTKRLAEVQARIDILNKSLEALQEKSEKAIASAIENCAERDLHHDEKLFLLQNNISNLATQLSFHQQELGHKGTLEQLVEIVREQGEIRAAIALGSQKREMALKIKRMEEQLERLQG